MVEQLRKKPNNASLDKVVQALQGIEADTTALASNASAASSVKMITTNKNHPKCFICKSTSYVKKDCDKPCKHCKRKGHRHED